MDAELHVRVRQMGLHGADGQVEPSSDVRVREPFGDEVGHLPFRIGQSHRCRGSATDPGELGGGTCLPRHGAESLERRLRVS